MKYFFINSNLKRKENYNFKCRTLLYFIIFYIVYSIFQSKYFRKKIINNVIYFSIQKNRIVLQTMKMGLKIILFVYSWLYCCITKLNLWNTFFWTNYLLLLNENLLNFTICRNKKLEGASPGPHFTGPDLGSIG